MANELTGYITRFKGKSGQDYGIFPIGSDTMLDRISQAENAVLVAENLVLTMEEKTQELEERTEELVAEAEAAVDVIKSVSMQKPYTINVYGPDNLAVMVGYEYGVDIKITKISTINISQLKYNILNGAHGTITLTDGKWEGELVITDGSKLYWEFEYVDSNKSASITVKQEQNE